MKISLITISVSVMFIISCGTQRNMVKEDTEMIIKDTEIEKIVGTIHVSEDPKSCPVYIEAAENGSIVTMYPVSIDESLKVEGQKIRFTYTVSRAMQPVACKVDKVVVLENIERLR